jgi:hypothetical protein
MIDVPAQRTAGLGGGAQGFAQKLKAEDCIGSAQIELRQEPRDRFLSASDTIP